MTSADEPKAAVGEEAKPPPDRVMDILLEGNSHFVRGTSRGENADEARRELAANSNQGDHALATVLCCSDSRVPVELIFDAGIMELFVVRVAGNVVDQATLASLEYGVLHAQTPLLVVLGHTDCGAVTATVNQVTKGAYPEEEHVRNLLNGIEPAVRRTLELLPRAGGKELVDRAVEENVCKSLEDMFTKSEPLKRAREAGLFRAVGAIYDLETGQVRFME